MKRFFKKDNVLLGMILFAISLACTCLLALPLSLVKFNEASFVERFANAFEMIFWIAGAGSAVGGILAIIIPKIANHAFGFGNAIYYGTVLISGFLDDFITADQSERLIIAFVIIALLCYIYWLKEIKPKDSQ